MVYQAGVIRAELILDTSKFASGINRAVSSVSTLNRTGKANIGGLATSTSKATRVMRMLDSSSSKAGKSTMTLSQRVAEARGSFTTMNTAVGQSPSKIGGFSGAITKAGGTVKSFGTGISKLMNTFVSFNVWFGILAAGLIGKYTVGAAMANEENKSMFRYMGMTNSEVESLVGNLNNYAAAASKVSMPELTNAWKKVRMSVKMTGAEMSKWTPVIGDTIALFKNEGRTAQDASLAISDAMSNQWRRMRELNIEKQDLLDTGLWKGSTKDVNGFFAALQKVYQDRGIEGYANKVTSLQDQWEMLKEKIQLAAMALGEVMIPALTALTSGFLGLISALGNEFTGLGIGIASSLIVLGFFWDTLSTIGSSIKYVTVKLAAYILSVEAGTVSQMGFAAAARAVTVSLLTNPWTWAILGVTALAAAVYMAGEHYGWFKSNVERANSALSRGKTAVDNAKKAQSEAQKEVDKWSAALAKATPGTAEYANAAEKLKIAKGKLAKATAEATRTENDYNNASERHAAIMNANAEASDRYVKALLRYKVATGQIKQAEAEQILKDTEWQSVLSEEDITTSKGTYSFNVLAGPTQALGEASLGAKLIGGTSITPTKGEKQYAYEGDIRTIALDAQKDLWAKNLAVAGLEFGRLKDQGWNLLESSWLVQPAKSILEYLTGGGKSTSLTPTSVGAETVSTVQTTGRADLTGMAKAGISALQSTIKSGISGQANLSSTGAAIANAGINLLKSRIKGFMNLTTHGSNIAKAGRNALTSHIRGSTNLSSIASSVRNAGVSDIRSGIKGSLNLSSLYTALKAAALGQLLIRGPGGSLRNIRNLIRTTRSSVATKRSATTADATARSIIGAHGPGDFTYEGYGGIGQSINDTLSRMAGNCVDGTLAQLALAQSFGIPAEMIMGTWMDSPHVWARIGGKDRDIANHSLTGSWNPPPAGPSTNNRIGREKADRSIHLHFHDKVYGMNDFGKQVRRILDAEVKGIF